MPMRAGRELSGEEMSAATSNVALVGPIKLFVPQELRPVRQPGEHTRLYEGTRRLGEQAELVVDVRGFHE